MERARMVVSPEVKRAIVEELRKYDEALFQKPRWMVLNKADLVPEDERSQRVEDFQRAYSQLVASPEKIFVISALTGDGCRELTYAIMEHLDRSRRLEQPEGAEL